jgi:transposase-like protein
MTTRRSFTAEFKVKVVLELISGEKGLAQASRDYGTIFYNTPSYSFCTEEENNGTNQMS